MNQAPPTSVLGCTMSVENLPDKSGKWKDALLRTSLPLEYLVAEKIVRAIKGASVTKKYLLRLVRQKRYLKRSDGYFHPPPY